MYFNKNKIFIKLNFASDIVFDLFKIFPLYFNFTAFVTPEYISFLSVT